MPFNSLAYLLILAISAIATAAVSYPAPVLVAASLIFYTVAGLFDTAVFLSSVTFNWLIQLLIPVGRARIAAATILNIGLIGYFKYRNFLVGDAAHAGSYIDTMLPLGISFYSLQAVAYHVDVCRKLSAPARSIQEFFLFKAFFPQLIAGPIVRAQKVLPQIQRLFDRRPRRHRLLTFGLGLVAMGLAKKVVFADSLGPFVDEIFAGHPSSSWQAWLGAILFTFQIYFDFSGYSDIAVGSAYLLGIRLPWNFRTPYISAAPREFWQRWHITLSTWIRDYLYIPLGGGRGHPVRTLLVLVLTMSLAGLWHGANYTFVVWGAAWALYLLVGRWLPIDRVPRLVMWPLHMLVVIALWVFFRSPNLNYALGYLHMMLSYQGGVTSAGDDASPFPIVSLGIMALFGLHWAESLLQSPRIPLLLRRIDGPVMRGMLAGLSIFLVLIPKYDVNPFIYFRF